VKGKGTAVDMDKEIYFDNSATTRPFDEVIDYMSYINREVYGNPSSLHTKGIEAERLMKKSRETIANSLDVSSKEIFFTSGGTEANNLAILGYLRANPRKGRHVLTTKIEHPSILEVFKYLQEEGYSVDYIDVDQNGIIDLDMLENKITSDTALISVMYVNNEMGAIQPINEIASIRNMCNKETILHVDAVQAYGKLQIKPIKSNINMITFSSHKIHGPKGVGALYKEDKIKIKPIILGGGQETLVRSGTENIPGICGFGLAAEIIHNNIENNWNTVSELNKMFRMMLEENIEEFSIISPQNSSPYILNVSFSNVKGEVLLHHLEEKNIYVSTGSACSSRKNKHSHVLKAMGYKSNKIDGAIRFSFCEFNSKQDIIETINALKEIIPKIRYDKYNQ